MLDTSSTLRPLSTSFDPPPFLPTKEDSRLDSIHLPRRLCSGIQAIGDVLTSTFGLSGVEKVSRVHSTGKSLDHHLSGGGLGQLNPRSPSVADQRVKVQFEKLNVEWTVEYGNLQVQCPKSDVGSENLKDKC